MADLRARYLQDLMPDLHRVNGAGRSAPGRDRNCQVTAVATIATLLGDPTPAPSRRFPHETGDPGTRWREAYEWGYGGRFETHPDEASMKRALRRIGPGALGLVYVRWKGAGAHATVLAHHRGGIDFIDGQTREVTADLRPYDHLEMMVIRPTLHASERHRADRIMDVFFSSAIVLPPDEFGRHVQTLGNPEDGELRGSFPRLADARREFLAIRERAWAVVGAFERSRGALPGARINPVDALMHTDRRLADAELDVELDPGQHPYRLRLGSFTAQQVAARYGTEAVRFGDSDKADRHMGSMPEGRRAVAFGRDPAGAWSARNVVRGKHHTYWIDPTSAEVRTHCDLAGPVSLVASDGQRLSRLRGRSPTRER